MGLSKQQILLLISASGAHLLAYYGGRALAVSSKSYNLAVPLDSQIPVIPWTILIYLGSFPFWAVNYIAGIKYDKGND